MLSEAGYWGSSVHRELENTVPSWRGLHVWAGPRYRAKTLEQELPVAVSRQADCPQVARTCFNHWQAAERATGH